MLLSDVCLSRTSYLVENRPRKTEIGTEIAHVTRDSDTQSSQFDVSFPEKLMKFVATRGKIFSLKFTKIPFGGRALPGPAGGAKVLPQTP